MRHLLKIDPQVKVIVSSGYSDSPVMQDYKQYGFSEAAGKPYSLLELSRPLIVCSAKPPHCNRMIRYE